VRAFLVGLLVTAGFAAVWPAASSAYVGCTHSAGTLRVFATTDEDRVTVSRGGDAINVIGKDQGGDLSILLACSGGDPTVTNTDLIAIENAETDFSVGAMIDLGGGPLAPGATPEADGSSEIEISARATGSYGLLGVSGGPGADAFDLGRSAGGALAVNLNAEAETEAPDPDLELVGREMLIVFGRKGADQIRAQGTPGFSGPFGAAFVGVGGQGADTIGGGTRLNLLRGGGGRDRLFGSVGRDLVLAGGGADRVVTGPGADLVLAKGGGRDKVNCGGGLDLALIDRDDKGRSCRRDDLRGVKLELSEPIEAAFAASFEFDGYD